MSSLPVSLGVDPGRPCKLIQLSDLHLPALRQQQYCERDVEQQLLSVLAHIEQHHPDLDGLLLSGDLVHQGHSAAYRRLDGYLSRFDKPWYWIAGNHDSHTAMRRIRPDQPVSLCCNGWRILLLDSTSAADGLGSGSLPDSELQRLQDQLQSAQEAGEALVLVLHHHPVPVQSRWQDQIMLGNAERLWQLLDRYRVPITLLFGHVHQVWEMNREHVRLLSCPSTAVQYVRGQMGLQIETEGDAALPGYRWLILEPAAALDQTNLNKCWPRSAVERVRLD